MATIKDIAQMAGVSIGTVSKVINGDETVSETRIERVRDAIQKLGYVPNFTARALKTNVTNSVGLILPDITNPYYAEFARGVENRLMEHSYSLFLCNKDRSTNKELNYLYALSAKNIDGIIMIRPASESINILKNQLKKPCIFFDCSSEVCDNSTVINVNDEAGAYLMMQHLYHLGHRKIVYCVGLTDAYSDQARKNGYFRFMQDYDLFDQELIWDYQSYSTEIAYKKTLAFISNRILPDAIFAANDLLAIGVMKALRECGISVPERISVAGYDDIMTASYIYPSLTTIERPKYSLGYHCAETLLRIIQGDNNNNTELITPKLIVRQSTAVCCHQ